METNPANGLAQEKGSAAFLIELEKQRAIKVETNFYLSLTKETINITRGCAGLRPGIFYIYI